MQTLTFRGRILSALVRQTQGTCLLNIIEYKKYIYRRRAQVIVQRERLCNSVYSGQMCSMHSNCLFSNRSAIISGSVMLVAIPER